MSIDKIQIINIESVDDQFLNWPNRSILDILRTHYWLKKCIYFGRKRWHINETQIVLNVILYMEGLLCIYCFGIIFFVFKPFNKFNLLKENKIVYKIWGLLSIVYLSDAKRRSILPDNPLIQPRGESR